ncbi:SH3 domain-containing protein [Neobacillus vireti]|uniref:N-acetylmuramoyl-L-alanine amidase, family 3 n=1 Tax=Neobacillus vireti LMG 21834 TaxID=1131730 RepID=A0AB94IIX1_9BACI|nr:SH3 domain-containing protein [Neobacillus vireti]ETI66962.1 N-acetylmuramoyl-L-alanine amidase, family 3 [Neobacillus vireti LMG 21834]KLT16875.1 N-acetylmuramoyl-L-alanine amidase [Neobacillus vireti]
MFKKFNLLLVGIILIFGAFLPQGKSIAATGSITISTDTVNVRGGPGLSYPLVKIAKRGEKYSIVSEKDDWIEIQLSFGKTGWVVNWLVSKENAATTASTAKASGSKSTSAAAKTDQLRVRSGPGTSFPIVGFLNKGQQVTVLDQNENWCKISSSSTEVWVASDFLEYKTVKQENTPAMPPEKTVTSGVVNGDTLNVRKEPSSSSTMVGKLTKGTTVTIYSKQNNWMEVGFSSLRGWVSAEFIDTSASPPSNDTAKKQSSGMNGTVTAGSLSVRSGASLDSGIIGSVSLGQSFTILEEFNNWAKIEFKSGSFGWVAGWYLEKSAVKTNTGQAVKESKVTILQNGTNIRKGPNVQSDVVERANAGDTFSVQSLANDWYEVKLKNGKTGFVAGWIVSTNGANPQIVKSGAEGYLKNKTIVLDPGHGGGDNGATGAAGTLEKELTLRTAQLLYDKLRAAGANVYLTRNNDSFLPLPSRVNTARAYHADAFISLHYDSNLDRSVRGMTGYYYHSYQKSLADTLYASTVAQTKLKNRGVRFGDFHVVRENSQKAVLMELGYLSNPEEEMTLKSSGFQESAASGLYDGLARYFKSN